MAADGLHIGERCPILRQVEGGETVHHRRKHGICRAETLEQERPPERSRHSFQMDSMRRTLSITPSGSAMGLDRTAHIHRAGIAQRTEAAGHFQRDGAGKGAIPAVRGPKPASGNSSATYSMIATDSQTLTAHVAAPAPGGGGDRLDGRIACRKIEAHQLFSKGMPQPCQRHPWAKGPGGVILIGNKQGQIRHRHPFRSKILSSLTIGAERPADQRKLLTSLIKTGDVRTGIAGAAFHHGGKATQPRPGFAALRVMGLGRATARRAACRAESFAAAP